MLRRLQEAKASKKAVLKVRCLRSLCCAHRLKGCFCELIENNRNVPLGEISGTFGAIPVETGEQRMKVLIMSNMLARWAQGVYNGSPVTINGGGAPV